jgi:hypothetical protein
MSFIHDLSSFSPARYFLLILQKANLVNITFSGHLYPIDMMTNISYQKLLLPTNYAEFCSSFFSPWEFPIESIGYKISFEK